MVLLRANEVRCSISHVWTTINSETVWSDLRFGRALPHDFIHPGREEAIHKHHNLMGTIGIVISARKPGETKDRTPSFTRDFRYNSPVKADWSATDTIWERPSHRICLKGLVSVAAREEEFARASLSKARPGDKAIAHFQWYFRDARKITSSADLDSTPTPDNPALLGASIALGAPMIDIRSEDQSCAGASYRHGNEDQFVGPTVPPSGPSTGRDRLERGTGDGTRRRFDDDINEHAARSSPIESISNEITRRSRSRRRSRPRHRRRRDWDGSAYGSTYRPNYDSPCRPSNASPDTHTDGRTSAHERRPAAADFKSEPRGTSPTRSLYRSKVIRTPPGAEVTQRSQETRNVDDLNQAWKERNTASEDAGRALEESDNPLETTTQGLFCEQTCHLPGLAPTYDHARGSGSQGMQPKLEVHAHADPPGRAVGPFMLSDGETSDVGLKYTSPARAQAQPSTRPELSTLALRSLEQSPPRYMLQTPKKEDSPAKFGSPSMSARRSPSKARLRSGTPASLKRGFSECDDGDDDDSRSESSLADEEDVRRRAEDLRAAQKTYRKEGRRRRRQVEREEIARKSRELEQMKERDML